MTIGNLRPFGLAVVVLAAWQASALAVNGIPSRAALDEMGLSGLRVMSDDEGLSVRGQGFGDDSSASAAGFSWASIVSEDGSAGSTDSYMRSGSHFAAGRNFSKAKIEIEHSDRDHGDDEHGDRDHGDKGDDHHGKDSHHGDRGHKDRGDQHGGDKDGRCDSGHHDGGDHHKGGDHHGGGDHKGGDDHHDGGKTHTVRAIAGGSSVART